MHEELFAIVPYCLLLHQLPLNLMRNVLRQLYQAGVILLILSERLYVKTALRNN